MCSFKWPFWEDSLSQIEHLQCDDLEGFDWQILFDKVDLEAFFLYLKLGNVTSHVTFAGEFFFTNRTISFMNTENELTQFTFLVEYFTRSLLL